MVLPKKSKAEAKIEGCLPTVNDRSTAHRQQQQVLKSNSAA